MVLLQSALASFNPHLSVLLAQKALSVLTTYGIKPSHGLQGWLSYSRFCPLHRYLSYYFPCLGKVYLYVTISSLSERPLELNFETGSFDARRFVMPTGRNAFTHANNNNNLCLSSLPWTSESSNQISLPEKEERQPARSLWAADCFRVEPLALTFETSFP